MASSEIMNQTTAAQARAENDQEFEIDLLGLVYRLLEKWYIIALTAIVGAAIAYGYTTYMVTPIYKATSALYVVNSSSAINVTDLQVSNYLAKDYMEVFSNWELIDEILSDPELDLDCTNSQLKSMISVTNPANTRLLYITISHENASVAKLLADKVVEHAQHFITEKMATREPQIFQKAMLPYRPSSPNKTRNVLVGFILGAVAAMAVYVIAFVMDDYIRTPDDIEKLLGLPTLGSIPVQEMDRDKNDKKRKHRKLFKGKGSKRK